MTDHWTKIKVALEHPQYKWRTLDGIAKETGYDLSTISSTLSDNAHVIVQSTLPSSTGQALFTTRDHYQQKSTLWERFESSITNKVLK